MIYKVTTMSSLKLRLRESPNVTSRVVGYLYKDKIYTFDRLSDDDKWAHTYYGGAGAEGWASMDYLRIPELNNDITIKFTRSELEALQEYLDRLAKGED